MRISTDPKEIKRKIRAWEGFLEKAPAKIAELRSTLGGNGSQRTLEKLTTHVAVVGCGMAGASAALEAAERQMQVVLVDMFEGGGSTRRSGGVVYAGGGTSVQSRHGVADTVEGMANYLKRECKGAVSDDGVANFCAESAANVSWLERHGVDFSGNLYESKTSYPPSDTSLYLSGNEKAYPYYSGSVKPAPRGHRPLGDHLTGNVLYEVLERALETNPLIEIRRHVRCEQLILEDDRVVGVVGKILPPSAHSMHTMLGEIAAMSSIIGDSLGQRKDPRPLWARCVEQQAALWAEVGSPIELRSSRGVVLATGGFAFNAEMVEKYCPKYLGLCPLGNLGDQGMGIQMALAAGAASARMDRCSAWKFINPPVSFVKGILLDPTGKRVRNEDCYGATLADELVQRFDGKGWLLLDQKGVDEAMASLGSLNPDQSAVALANIFKNREQADTLEDLATACGMASAEVAKSVEDYNSGASRGEDALHKLKEYLTEIREPPFIAINMDVRSQWWPTPLMTLGGLCLNDETGAVLNLRGESIPGLYAAGRTAVGVCSNSYVSGLSIADCLHGGRRAGRSVAGVVHASRL